MLPATRVFRRTRMKKDPVTKNKTIVTLSLSKPNKTRRKKERREKRIRLIIKIHKKK